MVAESETLVEHAAADACSPPSRDVRPAEDKLRLLVFSTLFPSSARPNHGIFVETRLRHLFASGRVEVKVVAPVPWFPSANDYFRSYASFARTPRREFRNGLDVHHPRYFLPPRIGMTAAPALLAGGAYRTVRRIIDQGFEPDVVDAHYYYPDGVAAALLAARLRKPCVITARGSDLNLISRYRLPRRMIAWAGQHSSASIGVCGALTGRLEEIGVPKDKLRVMRNGVDLRQFCPMDPLLARSTLGWDARPTFVSVGNLVELKGHHLVIEATAQLPDVRLAVVGAGPQRRRLERLAESLGIADRVLFAGSVSQDVLKLYYSASDALILASSREGWANVLLEAMACGTPVIATRIPGTVEVLGEGAQAEWMDERSAPAAAQAMRRLLARVIDRPRVRAYAERFSWSETTRAQLELFDAICRGVTPTPA